MIFLYFLMAVAVPGTAVRILEADLFRPSPSSFTCQGRPAGYYADVETGCRTYHVCDGVSHFTYVCPKRTLFRQDSRICDHSYLVRCEKDTDTANRDDEEEILARLAKFRKKLLRKENDNQEFSTTETIPPEEPTDISTTTSPATTTSPTTTTYPATTTPARTTQRFNPEQDDEGQSIRKFLKVRFKDPRSLFFIPELSNNSIVTESARELVLPLEEANVMRFRPRKLSAIFSSCPGHCNPRFFLPGTCHPCITIK